LAEKNVSEMTYFVSRGTWNLNSISHPLSSVCGTLYQVRWYQRMFSGKVGQIGQNTAIH